MNTGMHDAFNLAWKLSLASRGLCAAEPLLASYSLERSAVAKMVLEETGRTTAMAVMKGEAKQTIRNHVASLIFGLAPVRHAVANMLSEVSVGYPDSPLNRSCDFEHSGPAPGKRAPIRDGEPRVGEGPRRALPCLLRRTMPLRPWRGSLPTFSSLCCARPMMEVACGWCARMATLLSGPRVAMHTQCESICTACGSKAIHLPPRNSHRIQTEVVGQADSVGQPDRDARQLVPRG